MDFQLTPEHIQNGHLSEKDFSDAAGFPVKVFALSDFPHYDTLAQKFMLSPEQLSERANAIYQALKDNGLTQPHGPFDYSDARETADVVFSTIRSNIESMKLNSGEWQWNRHFNTICEQGYAQAHNAGSYLWYNMKFRTGKSEKDVFPGVLNEVVDVIAVFRKYATFLLSDTCANYKEDWARMTKMSDGLVLNFPNDNAFQLHMDLHERRHLQQLRIESTSVVPNFYEELDADMAASTILRQAGIGEQTITAELHSRYLEMLLGSRIYWFAASLEALERKEMPRNYFETSQAVAEVRMRLALKLLKEDKYNGLYKSHHLQAAYAVLEQHPHPGRVETLHPQRTISLLDHYDEYQKTVCRKNPAPLYTGLRQLVDDGVFTDPFSERLATKILEAAQYFNPHLIYADCRASRKILEECEHDGRPAQRTFLQKMMAPRAG